MFAIIGMLVVLAAVIGGFLMEHGPIRVLMQPSELVIIAGAAAGTLLPPGERIDAEMGFVDPGANAVGFEIDACLPTSDGEVTCANDTGSR